MFWTTQKAIEPSRTPFIVSLKIVEASYEDLPGLALALCHGSGGRAAFSRDAENGVEPRLLGEKGLHRAHRPGQVPALFDNAHDFDGGARLG